MNAKANHVAAFAIVRSLLLSGASGDSAGEQLGLGPHPFWQLQRVPTDMVNWPARNSHRLDVRLDRDFEACCGQQVVAEGVLGADEAWFWCSSDYLTTASSNNVDSSTGPL